jgi:RimJ/RimL family protein N-acetyltransferase
VLVGTVGTHLRGADEIEIGYWFASFAQGRGFAAEAAASVVHILAAAYPERRIVAECRPENFASRRLLRKIGFQSDGSNGQRSGRKRFLFSSKS